MSEQSHSPSCYKELTDSINLEDIAKEFVGDSHHRVKVFGKFS